MKKLSFIAIVLLIPLLPCFNQTRFWGELWSHHNYARNNLSEEQDFLLNTTVIRAGARLFLTKDSFSLVLAPYLEAQLVADALHSRHPNNIYNLHVKPSAGVKLSYRYYNSDGYLQFLEADLYTEYRRLLNLSDQTEEQFQEISKYDLVGGIKIWANSEQSTTIGMELWCDLLSYRLTNFAVLDQHHYLINTISPVILIRPFTYKSKISIYEIDYLQQLALSINPEITIDFFANDYNHNPFSNKIILRAGVRWVCPVKYHENNLGKKYINLLFYTDYTMVLWRNPYYDWELPGEDFRAGLMLYIPFRSGEKISKWRI